MAKKSKGFPVSHVVGFILSLVLTFTAAGVALKTSLPLKTIIWIIGSLAIVQAVLQLYMFMHMNEGEDAKAQTINIIYAFFIAVVTVAGSIWVMSSGHMYHM
ncbi:cytochrome aa3 quinol oxidase subunit IV [Bacillus methanolicus PB1]|uniref:Quinol oxidase subunit 4 n=1 Tax=Bacillus methanolicus PB1 TaxID=997296 RepID=I3DVU0_BACMT|nr:cytochrome aa3 quinol oxidase subunit IV [Bacillus methanolicus]EIJ78361.1 cytochrome aa3 quinol oxidase subunit IV [Bacillus methanolicus PB1]